MILLYGVFDMLKMKQLEETLIIINIYKIGKKSRLDLFK